MGHFIGVIVDTFMWAITYLHKCGVDIVKTLLAWLRHYRLGLPTFFVKMFAMVPIPPF